MSIFAAFALHGIVIPQSSDSDVQSYLDAVYTSGGALSNTEITAVENLVSDLKTAGIFSNFHGLYPLLGGSLLSIPWNLADVTQYNLYNLGGWTAGSYGITGGTAGAYTGIPGNIASGDYLNFGLYIGNNAQGGGWRGGNLSLEPRSVADNATINWGGGLTTTLSGITDSNAIYQGQEGPSSNVYLYRNTSSANATGAASADATEMYLTPSSMHYGIAWIYTGGAVINSDMYTIIGSFVSTLGR